MKECQKTDMILFAHGGTIKPVLQEFCNKVDRDFNKFLIHDGKNMHVKMNNDVKFDIGLHGLCTYDKLGLIKDFIKDSKIIYGESPSLEELEEKIRYDSRLYRLSQSLSSKG